MRVQKERKPTDSRSVSFQSEVSPQASFSQIIHHLAQKASQCAKLDPKRVGRAVDLVLHPGRREMGWVWAKDCETLNICGHSGQWYRVDGQCECADHQRHGYDWWCKHRIARALIIKAEEWMEAHPYMERSAPAPQVKSSHYQVWQVFFDLEDMLDWKLSAMSLDQEAEERAWQRLPEGVDDELETELEVDGQHLVVRFLRAR